MTSTDRSDDEAAILRRLDRSSPELLLNSLVSEIARLGRDLAEASARLAVFESLVAVADRIAASGEDNLSTAYPATFTIGAAHPSLSAPEFYALEHARDGAPLRWSGPDRQISFTFFLDRSRRAHFKLEFDSAYFSEPVETMLCFVDGRDISMSFNKRGAGFVASGVLPSRREKGGSVLTFVCPSTKSPSEVGSADIRKLGIRFRRLTVETEAAPDFGARASSQEPRGADVDPENDPQS